MSKKHDENRDLRSVSKIAKITPAQKTIECSKSATIGIHMWGRIDYLTKYCGWVFIWNNSAGTSYGQFDNADKSTARAKKKAQKEPKLTDKTKKKSNKK